MKITPTMKRESRNSGFASPVFHPKKWPPWSDCPYHRDGAAPLKKGAGIYQRLCQETTLELSNETGIGRFVHVWWEEPRTHWKSDDYSKQNQSRGRRRWEIVDKPTHILRHSTGWARFVVDQEAELAAIQEEYRTIRKFWEQVATEMNDGVYLAIINE